MLETALGFLSRGYVVIPVGKDKRPLISWKPFQKEIPGPSQVKEWWEAHPEAQMGIITGEISNLTVIDVEADGDPSMFMKYDTYTVKTGGGGWHFYFEYEPTVANSVRSLPQTDVRSEGGYVVGPGSKTEKGEYTVIKDSRPMRMPPEIRHIFEKKEPVFRNPLENAPVSEEIPAIEYDGAGEGGRNDALTRFAGALLAKTHPAIWDQVAWPALLQANRKNNPPLPEYEVRMIFNSICERERPRTGERRYGERRPQPTSLPNRITPSGSLTESSTETKPLSIITLEEAAATQKIDVDSKVSTNIPIFDEALLGGLTPGDLIVVMGRSGVGKTTFTQDLSASFLTQGHGALWFSYEVMAVPLYRKFLDMQLSDEAYGRLFVPAPPLTSSFEEIYATIKKAKEEHGVRVVAIDHIGFIDLDMDKGTNHALAVTHLTRALKRLAVDLEITVIIPVHVNKVQTTEPSLEDVRDSYGIVQEADAVFIIDRKRSTTSAEKEASYYSQLVKIVLAKNRVTGVSKSGTFSLLNGRYAYQEALSQAEEAEPLSYRERKTLSKEADALWKEMGGE